MSKLIKFQDEIDKGEVINLTYVHTNKMKCKEYFWNWSSNHGDWIRTEKINKDE